jgi:hydrogenase maturation protease
VKVLVAGVGNVLRGDDGFGVEVAQLLQRERLPDGVSVMDVGIGGIHLVQELHDAVDALILVDAVELGRPAGTLVVIRPTVRVPAGPDDLADVHYANPERALMLAGALGVLPAINWLLGCQPRDLDRLGEGLSPEVAAAVGPAAAEVRRLVCELGVEWPG